MRLTTAQRFDLQVDGSARRFVSARPATGHAGPRLSIAKASAAVAQGFGAYPDLHPATRAWLLRRQVQPSVAYARAVDAFVVRPLVAAGVWRVLDGLYLFADDPTIGTAATNDSRLNLKQATYTALPVNSPVFLPGFGWAGDGATSYLDTGFSAASATSRYGLNSAHVAMWQMTDIPGLGFLVATAGTGTRTALRGRNGTAGTAYVNANTGGILTGAYSGTGFFGASRLDANGFFGGKGGDGFTSFIVSSSSLPSQSLRIGRLGTGTTYDPNQCAFMSFGGGLTSDQLGVLHDVILSLLIFIATIDDDAQPNPVSFISGCFDQSQLATVTPSGLDIGHQVPPPPDNTANSSNFIYLPATFYSTQQAQAIVASTFPGVKGEHFIWGYRELLPPSTTGSGFPNVRPSPISTAIFSQSTRRECRLRYSTRAKARAAWIVQQRYSAGALARNDTRYPDGRGWLDVADAAGFSTTGWAGRTGTDLTTNIAIDTGGGAAAGNAVVHHAQLLANPDSYFTTPVQNYVTALDIVYLPIGRLCDSLTVTPYGFLRDTEDQTKLTPAELLSTVREAATSCHATGHKLTIYANPLNGGGARATGFDESNVDDIIDAADWLSVVAYPGNIEKSIQASVNNQIAMFQRPVRWDKIMLVVGIGAAKQEISGADADWLHGWMVSHNIRRMQFWRNNAALGGPLYRAPNQVIARVLGLPLIAGASTFDTATFDGATFA